MLTALLSLAAAVSERVEPDKTAYYIAAGVLAGWAVLVGALGMMRPDFPKSSGATRGVMGIGIFLTIAAMVSVLATA